METFTDINDFSDFLIENDEGIERYASKNMNVKTL